MVKKKKKNPTGSLKDMSRAPFELFTEAVKKLQLLHN